MKAITTIFALILASHAFAGDYVESSREIIARMKPQMPDVIVEARKSAVNRTPYVPTPDAPARASSTDYTIVILPDGKSASALTYH